MKNNNILLIETATDTCSAAITDGKGIVASMFTDTPKSQASGLVPMIMDTLHQAGMEVKDMSAVAVSSGPGSYTGLRVGVSTAKGLCMGAGLPLIGVDTLTIVVQGVLGNVKAPRTLVIPMIDARRMEVYTALYDSSGTKLTGTQAVILTPETFSDQLGSYDTVIFAGNGVEKYRDMVPAGLAGKCLFLPSCPDAVHMLVPAVRAWQEKRFEDLAYFEPFYLKEFMASGPSKKMDALLHG